METKLNPRAMADGTLDPPLIQLQFHATAWNTTHAEITGRVGLEILSQTAFFYRMRESTRSTLILPKQVISARAKLLGSHYATV